MIKYNIEELRQRYCENKNKLKHRIVCLLIIFLCILYLSIYNTDKFNIFYIIIYSLVLIIYYWFLILIYQFIKNSLFAIEMNKVIANYKNSYNAEKLLSDLINLKRTPISKSRGALAWKYNIIMALELTNNDKDSMFLLNNSNLTYKQKEFLAKTTNSILKKLISNNYINEEIFWDIIYEHNIIERLNINILEYEVDDTESFLDEDYISIYYSADENKFFVSIKEITNTTDKINVFTNEEKTYKYALEYLYYRLKNKTQD